MAGTIMKDHVIVKSGNRFHRHAAVPPIWDLFPTVTVCKAEIAANRVGWRFGRFDEITCQNCKDLLSRV